jgi:ribosomal protein S18 acetylase RimI-like enzyme
MDTLFPNDARILPRANAGRTGIRFMPLRRVYWALRRNMIQRQLLVFAHNGGPPPEQAPSKAPLISISAAGPKAELVADAIARQSDLKRAIIIDRLTAGHRIVHATAADGRLLAWGWIALPSAPTWLSWETGLNLEIDAGIGYLFDFETMPAARNYGLYRRLLDHAARHCMAQGASQVGVYCRAENEASRRGILAAGFTAPKTLSVLRLGPFFRVATQNLAYSRWLIRSVPLAGLLLT